MCISLSLVKSNNNISEIDNSNFFLKKHFLLAKKEKTEILESNSQKLECDYIKYIKDVFVENIIVNYDDLGIVFYLMGQLKRENLLFIDMTGGISNANLILFLTTFYRFVVNIGFECNVCFVCNSKDEEKIYRTYNNIKNYMLI